MSQPPNPYEQADERSRDELTRTELCNMIYDLPATDELLVDGEDEGWRPITITVGFRDGTGTGTVAKVMRRQGYELSNVTFAPYNRLTFVERDE